MLRLTTLEEPEHIAPAFDSAIRCGCPCCAQAQEGLKSRHRLFSPVVAEHKLIEVCLELAPADSMVSANQPVLQVADDPIGEWYDRLGSPAERRAQGLLEWNMPIPSGLQPGKCREAVAVDRRASRDVLFHECPHRWGCEVRQDDEANATGPIIAPFNGDHNGNRAPIFELTASFNACLVAANPRVIEFDLTVERFPRRVDHRSAQFVKHHPRSFIA